MFPCDPKNNCYCVYYLLKESKEALLQEFNKKETVGLQKQYVYDMLSSSSDDDGFSRCFKVPENMFLCRHGLSNVLQLSHQKKQSIVPSSKTITKRYSLLCISEIFNALVLYRTSLIQLCRFRSENPFAETVNWSSPFLWMPSRKLIGSTRTVGRMESLLFAPIWELPKQSKTKK
jgi:hypothetical protein